MLLDKNLEFCDAVAVANDAGTFLLGNVIDLGAVSLDIGQGDPMYLCIQTDTEIITAGSAGTVQFQLASDAQAAIATDASATEHIITAEYVTDDAAANSAALNAGGTIFFGVLPMGAVYERYLGILMVVGTTSITAGKINAFLTADPHGWRAYPDGI